MSISTVPTQEVLSSTKTMSSAIEMIDRLNSLEPDADTKAATRIAELFPALVEAKRRGNSKQQVLTLLSEMGLTLHHAKFSKLFNAEKKAREEHGERIADERANEDDESAVDEAQLKAWKKELGALKKRLKAQQAAFAEHLNAAVDALDEPQAATLLLSILRQDMQAILDRYVGAQRQQIVAAFENWWDKYRVTLVEIERERDTAAGELQGFLTALGYV